MMTTQIRCGQWAHRTRACGMALGRAIASVVLACAISACGFHLRGEATYAFSSLYLSSAAPGINTELTRALRAAGTAKVVDKADEAEVILEINSVEDDKHILSLSSGGKVFEFLLTKRVLFRVHDAAGNDWLPTAEVIIRRTYTYSDTEVLAKAYEEQRLWREMQTDAVQQIVRRLQAARKPEA